MKSGFSKSLSKRIRFTKNGKIVRRPMAVDHSRTRKSPKNVRSRRKTLSLNFPKKRILNY